MAGAATGVESDVEVEGCAGAAVLDMVSSVRDGREKRCS